MPPLEIFAGMEDLLLAKSDTTTPTREQLAALYQEHDQIERETEQFDAGDMLKLKKFAKGSCSCSLLKRILIHFTSCHSAKPIS
jgi:hypothetical protein